jgi:hypothetical protein
MMMKQIAMSSFTVLALTASASAQDIVFHAGQWVAEAKAGIAGFRVPIESKMVTGAPYSAEVISESVQTLADGNRIVQRSTTRVYRDSEGRIRREEDRPSGGPAISITDPVARVSFSLDPESRVAFQSPHVMTKITEAMQQLHVKLDERFPARPDTVVTLPEGGTRVFSGGGTAVFSEGVTIAVNPLEARRLDQQIKVETLAARDIEGVRANGVRRTTTIPAGEIGNEWPIEIVSEEWFSPDLQILLSTDRTDPRLGTSTYRVVNITRAEPARYLFEIPADYTVKSAGLQEKLKILRTQ